MSVDAGLPVESKQLRSYHRATRTGTYGFLASLPLLLLYEGMMLIVGTGQMVQVRVGAEVWSKQILTFIGLRGSLALGLAVILVGIAVAYAERRKRIPLRGRYFYWIVLESAVYALAVALLISTLVGWLFALFQTGETVAPPRYFTLLALSIGAGIYEELIFRVVLVGGLYLLIRTFYRGGAYAVAAVVGAAIFSAVHYVGPLGDPFALDSFTFRFFFGLAMNVLFLWRGFAVAAWTHALYDVLVVTRLAF